MTSSSTPHTKGGQQVPGRPAETLEDEASILHLLEEARQRTHELIAPIAERDYMVIHHPVMGPVAWDVGHIGQQEDLWLVQTLGGQPETLRDGNDVYDAYKHPRPTRADLPLMDKDAVKRYHEQVRERSLQTVERMPRDPQNPLWRDLYVMKMVVQHEHQHNETILQHLAAFPEGRYVPPDRREAPVASTPPDSGSFIQIRGGASQMGVPPHTGWTYDNEWPRHEVDVGPFWLQQTPVTNRQFLNFVEAGGYQDGALWDPRGHRLIVQELDADAPMYWDRRSSGWTLRMFDQTIPLPLDHPVMNISWYEADAFARWAGFRLPTEAEWEKAATWDAATKTKRTWPWGEATPTSDHANLDQRRYGTDPVGSHPQGATPDGIHQLVGDVWEWTATTFDDYPGYEPFPYREYSEIFFNKGLKVLRGGSWATRRSLRLGTFRNWDLPQRRQIFAGVRLAADSRENPPSLDRVM